VDELPVTGIDFILRMIVQADGNEPANLSCDINFAAIEGGDDVDVEGILHLRSRSVFKGGDCISQIRDCEKEKPAEDRPGGSSLGGRMRLSALGRDRQEEKAPPGKQRENFS
jgi:hypothetical protein